MKPTETSTATHPRRAIRAAQSRPARPVLFVLDDDPASLDVLLSDLTRRFGNDFTLRGGISPETALCALEQMADANVAVALFLVNQDATGFLTRAHQLHPRAKRVLLVDRDYSATSPAVPAITLGDADYHIVRPWFDDKMMYRAISEYVSAWTREQEPSFELFRIVAAEGDRKVPLLRDVMTRFSMPLGFYALDSEAGQRLLDEAGVDATRLPVVVRYDGQVMIDPDLPELARAVGAQVSNDIDTCELAIIGAGPSGLAAAVYGASEGPRDGDARARGVWGTGRYQPDDQELPRVPPRHRWWSADGANLRAGLADGSAHRVCSGSGRTGTARRPSSRAAARRNRRPRAQSSSRPESNGGGSAFRNSKH